MKEDNKRQSIRFLDPDSTSVTLSFYNESREKKLITALIRDESIHGMACVYVGKEGFEKGKIIFWEEAANISTACEVVRCINITEDIFSIALKFN
jgi:hypothetical protein